MSNDTHRLLNQDPKERCWSSSALGNLVGILYHFNHMYIVHFLKFILLQFMNNLTYNQFIYLK